jgi:hypothetical protein
VRRMRAPDAGGLPGGAGTELALECTRFPAHLCHCVRVEPEWGSDYSSGESSHATTL